MQWFYKKLLLLSLLSFNAYAVNSIPPGIIEQVDPGRTGDQLTPEPQIPQLLSPEIKTPAPIKSHLPAEKKILLKLQSVKLIGNTVFSEKKLSTLYAQYIDTDVSLDDIKTIAQRITMFYRNSGYILAQTIIPPQEIDDQNKILLEIYEGYVDEITIDGTLRSATKTLLNEYAAHIKAHRPLTLAVLERYTLLANDLPGVKVRTILAPSESTAGAAKLTMQANQQLNDWYAGANNFNAEVLGREQMVGGIHANGYLPGSQTGLRGVMSFCVHRFKYFAFSHKQQLNSQGLGFDGSVSNTNTNPNFDSLDLVYLQTPGQAFILNGNFIYPFIRSRQKNLNFSAGFNYLNSHTSYYGVELFNDATRSINAKIAYNFLLADQSMNTLEAGIYQGLNILNAHASPPTIIGGKTNFSKITGSASRYQKLPAKNCYLLIWAKGQYSFTKELSSEKFGFGGAPFGYGYDPSVITGDHGYALKLEPQYNINFKMQYMPYLQMFGFFDTGSVWNLSGENQPEHQSATSMGAGVRTILIKRFNIELIVAKPFNIYATNNDKNNTRVMFNAYYSGGTIFG